MKKFTLLLLLLFAIVSLRAQDYLISFAGKGASTTVGTVKVENLTQNKSITLSGTEVLHLVAISTGINPELDVESALRIYPNPTTGNSTIEFVAIASGVANVELFDITGKRLSAAQNALTIGTNSYQVSGLRSGIYTIRIYSQSYNYSGKLVSNGTPNSGIKISYNGNSVTPITAKMLKSASTEKIMQYTKGDRLKYTGTSGNYATITTNIPTESKTLTFTFVPCTDAIGNNYSILQLGTQIWMGENLKTTKYRNGDLIPNVTNNTLWSNLRTGAYCDYDNRIEYSAIYGKLYNWHAVNDIRNIAPTGWHVPTDAEWMQLTLFLGGKDVAGGKLRETGTTHWENPNTNATNESGFTALPGGYRLSNSKFGDVGRVNTWWSSTEVDPSQAWLWLVSNGEGKIGSDNGLKETGFSVRCVSDVTLAAGLPVINTTTVTTITATTATCGGNITSDGGAIVTARGVCWSTDQNPIIDNAKTIVGAGVGSFTSSLVGLSPGTKYYVRAYATNSAGTGYGSSWSFSTLPETETVTDVDGNIYHTVIIGTQIWMVENLKTSKYNDGTSILNMTDNATWGTATTSGYCWYNNYIANKDIYGALYNWYAINTGKLAPKGWHVPSHNEWSILTTYLVGEEDWRGIASGAGGKLKETGTNHWLSPNTEATNSVNFTALPGGIRDVSGTFINIGVAGFWWSSTGNFSAQAWNRSMYNSSSDVYRGDPADKKTGFSIRCVKDAPSIPTVNTIGVSNITTISAICGGNISFDGGLDITERGICYSTSQNPTISNSKIAMGFGTGDFRNTLTGLSANTTYHLRAYASNSAGTAYGADIQFSTLADITKLWVVGGYNGWDNSDNALFIMNTPTTGANGEGYINFATAGDFKLTTDRSWDDAHTYGEEGTSTGKLSNVGGGKNISVPSAGYYLIKANLITMTYSLTKTTWGIIGDATAGKWDTQTNMVYDPTTLTFQLAAHLTAGGSFKFRGTSDWGINYGIKAGISNLLADGDIIPVTLESDYAITLDLSHPNAYTYSANTWGLFGDATPGGWDTDTNMTWDTTNKVFKVTLDLTAAKFKFRANDALTTNLGGDINALTLNGANIAIAAAGNYTITLDPWTYKATIKKN